MATSTLGSGTLVLAGTTSGTTTVTATAVAGTTTLTLPAATDTLVGKATTDTLTNKTLTTPTISQLSSAAATALTLQSAGTTAITINTSQNVGIGTNSPTSRLEVVGGRSFFAPASETYAVGARYVSTGGSFYFGASDGTSTPDGVFSQSGGSERMRITNGGRVLVNATTDVVGNNPAFIVNGSGFSNASEFRVTSTTSYYNVMVANGNGFLGGINTSGSTTTYTNLSDYRVKENINPIVNALDKIELLKPCTFTYKIDGIDGQGFIAHELQEVFPDAVVGEKDAVNADGKPIYQGIDTSFLVATLTAAIQEQQALITALTTRIAALEGA